MFVVEVLCPLHSPFFRLWPPIGLAVIRMISARQLRTSPLKSLSDIMPASGSFGICSLNFSLGVLPNFESLGITTAPV